MSVVYDRFGVTVHHGDCLKVLAGFPDESFSSAVTDPPAGVAFMGRQWDTFRSRDRFVEFITDRMTEALRVVKPGGHALVWGLPRTSHWTAWALEDAGWEVRDCITHLFGQGYAKSLNAQRAIDMQVCSLPGQHLANSRSVLPPHAHVCPESEQGGPWAGFGTALKPSSEHWWLVRKPFRGPVAGNVLEHGTGALNLDACRVAAKGRPLIQSKSEGSTGVFGDGPNGSSAVGTTDQGRWPPNTVLSHGVLLDPDTGEVVGDACADGCVPGCAVADLDTQSGISTPSYRIARRDQPKAKDVYGRYGSRAAGETHGHADAGGASRFVPVFRWEPKAPPAERPRVNGKSHPTVKPVHLMRWLVRLITPPGGTVLDLFAGTGTTGQAARAEGFSAVLIESDPEALPWITARLDALPKTEAPPEGAPAVVDSGPVDLFALLDQR